MSLLCNEPFHWKSETDSEEAFLLLHGLGGGCYEMRLLGERLHQQGYTVAGINYPGHDAPAPQMPNSTWEQWFQHVEASYRELSANHSKVSVVGFSTGSLLALHLASQVATHQPVERLVLLSPFLKIRHSWYYLATPELYVHTLGQILWQIPRFYLPIKDPEMRLLAAQAAYYKTFNLRAVRSALGLIQVVSKNLENIDRPTLIIQSPHDSVVCPSGANILMQRLGSPIKQVHWLETSDHIILLDTERDIVADKILNFIKSGDTPA